MKIKILVSIAGSNFSYRPGEIAELNEKEAKSWIKAGVAEKAPAKKKAEPKAKAPAAAATTPAPKKPATGGKAKK